MTGTGWLERFDGDLDGAGTGAELARFDQMEEAFVRPPQPPEFEIEQDDPTEAVLAELDAERTRLAESVAAAEVGAIVAATSIRARAAEEISGVARAALGHLVDIGFAAELAGAIGQIIDGLDPPAMALSVAPDDLEPIGQRLAATGTDISVATDPTLMPGEARLSWESGGAEFDADQLKARIGSLLADRIDTLAKGENDDN